MYELHRLKLRQKSRWRRQRQRDFGPLQQPAKERENCLIQTRRKAAPEDCWGDWKIWTKNGGAATQGCEAEFTRIQYTARKRLKTIEAQTALIRHVQRKSRLKQQILLGLRGVANAPLATWLTQRFVAKS
jgi:hypothetical protein